MSKLYHCTLTEDATINGQDIKAGAPLAVRLYDKEDPQHFAFLIQREFSQVEVGGLHPIGYAPLRDLWKIIKWTDKRAKK